jgi:uncharacterized membrane protein (Fun14 family)
MPPPPHKPLSKEAGEQAGVGVVAGVASGFALRLLKAVGWASLGLAVGLAYGVRAAEDRGLITVDYERSRAFAVAAAKPVYEELKSLASRSSGGLQGALTTESGASAQ